MFRLLVKDWSTFTSNDTPNREAAAVISLLEQFMERNDLPHCVAASGYVLLHAADKRNGASLVTTVSNMAEFSGNPCLRGWTCEKQQMEVIKSVFKELQKVKDLGIASHAYIGTKEGLALSPNHKMSHDGEVFTDCAIGDNGSTKIWCRKWNQGCFALAFM